MWIKLLRYILKIYDFNYDINSGNIFFYIFILQIPSKLIIEILTDNAYKYEKYDNNNIYYMSVTFQICNIS